MKKLFVLLKVKMYLFLLTVLMLLSGCPKSSDVLLPGPESPKPLVTRPFAAVMVKGETLTLDISSYLSSTAPYQLLSVSDPKALVSDAVINGSSFTIKANYAGTTSLEWKVTQEGVLYTSSGILAIQTSSGSNTPPKAEIVTRSTTQDAPITIDLSHAVSDADSDVLAITEFIQAGERFSQNGMDVTYTPNGFVGHDLALYAVEDGNGGAAIGSISVAVSRSALNSPPTAKNYAQTIVQGENVSISVGELASDDDGGVVSLKQLIGSSSRAIISSATTITYTSGSFSGEDEFVYVVSDGQGGIAQAKVSMTVTPLVAPTPLLARPIVVEMMIGDTISVNVSAGVSAGSDWSLTTVTPVTATDDNVTLGAITPSTVGLTAISSGVSTLSYTVTTSSKSVASEIIVAVSEANNNAPTAQPIKGGTNSITAISLDISGYISDGDGDSLTVTDIKQVGARFALSGSTITYTPSGFVGVDVATYVVEDGRGGYGLGQIVVNVIDASSPTPTPPNNIPTAKDAAQATGSATATVLDLDALGLISDADNDTLTVTLFGGSGRATVDNHVITYAPGGYFGVDTVIYQVSDPHGGVAIATIIYTISDATSINKVPIASAKTINLTLQEVLSQPVRSIDISSLVSDADGDALTVINVYAAANPAVIDGALRINYTASKSVATDKFSYVVSDGRGGFTQNVITVNVTNAAPVVRSVAENIDPYDPATPSVVIDLARYASDSDGDALFITQLGDVALPATLTQSGLILTYTPNGAVRTEVIPYEVSDGKASARNVISIISASQGSVTANPITVAAIAMDAPVQTIDVSSYVSNTAGRALAISNVFGATLGVTAVTPSALTFTYTPNDISFGVDTLYYVVVDGEGHSAQAQVKITLSPSPQPSITDITLLPDTDGNLIASVACVDCDMARVDRLFDIDGVPAGTQSIPNTGLGGKTVGVIVTAKNRYCTAANTGVSGGNACKTTQGRLRRLMGRYITKIFSTSNAFAALNIDGSVVTWGNVSEGGDSSAVATKLTSGVTTVFSTYTAFAALKADGSVVTWGEASNGGNSSAVVTDLASGVTNIFSTNSAFAALKTDGSVVTWGDNLYGGDRGVVTTDLASGVTTIFSTGTAFAALKADGSVVTWGNNFNGGNSSAVTTDLASGVTTIFSTRTAFAALKVDGSVVTWGIGNFGGNSSAVTTDLASGVTQIFSTSTAFAALKTDGSVVTWGEVSQGGNSSAVATDLASGVTNVFSTLSAFAALKADGSVVTWGINFGGDSSAVATDLASGVTTVFSAHLAFAALKADGSVVTWGEDTYGGDSSAVATDLASGVTNMFATGRAFAALKADGSLVTWGIANFGGDSSAVATDLASGVTNVFSTNLAFAALKADGSVVTWGDISNGGDSSTVQGDLQGSVGRVVSKDLSLN